MTTKKIIPKFSTPTEQTREIDGQPVTVRRLPADLAPDVLSRLLSDVGSVVVEILSSPDRELDPGIEGAVRGMIASKGGASAGIDMTVTIIKALVFSNAIAKVKDFDFGWYVRSMLPKCMAIAGVDVDTMEELNQSGVTPRTLFEVFRFACEVNFFPTSAGSDTSDGRQDPTPPAQELSRIKGKSSIRGATAKVGQPGQTSAATT
jgi:hypothetical protein